MTYVKFPGGTRNPGGYVVPCEPTGRTSGDQTHVTLESEDGEHTWTQWVRNSQLLTDEEVECE